MPSAGEMLRDERLKQRRDLSEIAASTRISTRYLFAIEADDVKQLPGEFFYKAFLRQYAKALDLDSATTDIILASAVPVEEPDPLPVLNQVYDNAQTGRSARWAPPTGVAIGVLAVVLAGGAGLYAVWQKFQARDAAVEVEPAAQVRPVIAPVEPVSESVPSRAEPLLPPSSPSTDTTAAPIAAGSAPTPSAATQPSVVLPDTSGMTVDLAALEPTWVQLSSAGKTVYIGTLSPSEPRQFALANDAKLLTGNAGGLDVRMNGKPLGAIGPRGQIRTVVFTAGNFQILQTRPRGVETFSGASGVSERPIAVDR